MKKKYTVAIIGAGSIGALKPDKYDSPTTKNVLTHAHACYSHPMIDLKVIVDIDKEKARLAADKWGCHYRHHVDEISNYGNIDIIIVATPTETHLKVLGPLIKLKPKLVIAEKPFTENIKQAKAISDLYKEYQIPLAVNYSRRFVPVYNYIAQTYFGHGLFGNILNCSFHYTRGLKREGCHAIDLFNWFFGDVIDCNIVSDNYIEDYSPDDRTCAAYFQYERCPHVFMFPCDGRKAAIFEMDMIFEKGRIKFIDHGLTCQIFTTEKEKTYGDYDVFGDEPFVSWPTHLNNACSFLINNAVDFLDGESPLRCTDAEALKVHDVYWKLGL